MKLSSVKKIIREEVKRVLHEDATNQTVVDIVAKTTLDNFGPKVKARVLHFKDNMYTVGLRKGINGLYDPRYYSMLADDLRNNLPKEWLEQSSVDAVKIGTGGATEGSIILRLSPVGIKAVGKLARFGESIIKEAYPRSTPNTKLTLSLIKNQNKMRKPKLLKESMMSEIDLLAQESDDVKTFLSKLKPFLQKFAADDKAYADPKVLKGIVAMYFDPKGVKVAMDESVSKLTEMIRAEIKKVLKEDSRQATSAEFQKASKFAATKGMKLSSIGVDKKTGKVKIQASKSETSPEEEFELDESVPTLRKLKVGSFVTPKIGPHKGQKHEIIHDFGNGKYNIKPVGLTGAQIKYKLGAAGATEDQFDVVRESIKKPSKR